MTATSAIDRNRFIRLSSGRRLGFAEFGDPGGKPVFYFHGSPGSRLEGEWFTTEDAGGVRLICPDRPGYGLSERHPGRAIVDWPDDVRQLADTLGIERFAVAGISGGGPYVLACAALLPSRVVAAGLISSAAPSDVARDAQQMHAGNRLAIFVLNRAPFLLRPLFGSVGFLTKRFPDTYARIGLKALPEWDQRVAQDERYHRLSRAGAGEAFRQGSWGIIDDARLDFAPWGIDLAAISVPVFQWHGEQDHNVPVAEAQQFAARIPTNTLTVFPNEGHLLIPPHWLAVVQAFTDAWPAS